MVDFVPAERANPIRYPSTANLMIDSADRTTNLSAWDFQIAKRQSILNGFFTRIATTEVVLEWCEENVKSTDLSNNTITFDISGISPNTHAGSHTISLISGFYTAAEAYDSIVASLNDISGTTGCVFTVAATPFGHALECTGGFFEVNNSRLATQLDLDNAVSILVGAGVTGVPLNCPDLRPYRYIDFVAPQLTYAQGLKDATTNTTDRDVLCRWYFSYDEQNILDKYGFPILMGYTRFCLRRLFNPPKQIKYDSNLPLGNLSFQVFDEEGNLLPASSAKTNWLMTLQVSEV